MGGYKYELYDYWALYFEVGDSVKVKGSFELFVYKKNRKIIKLDYRILKEIFSKKFWYEKVPKNHEYDKYIWDDLVLI